VSNSKAVLVHTNSGKYEVAASNPRALAKILSHVRYEGDCWIWTGALSSRGYAVGTSNKASVYVHRLSHWIVVGPVADGLVLDHLCRRPSCVNPLHTEVVTTAENTRRGAGNGSQTHCPQHHPYDETNTRFHTDKRGYTRRMCITCQNDRNAAYRAKGSNRKAA
jgi:hypothetical protein